MNIIIWFLVIMNAIGFFLMGEDKRRAKKHEYRISERTLWLTAIAGGAFAMTVAMYVFHHKTKHPAFKLGFPIVFMIQTVVVFYLFSK